MSNIGKEFRLAEFFDRADNRTIILDTSSLASVGLAQDMAKSWERLDEVAGQFDALIVSAAQINRLSEKFNGSTFIARLDWTNLFRMDSFVLPPTEIKHIPIVDPDDIFSFGATAAVCYLLFGYDEEIEAKMIEYISGITRACYKSGIPLLVDIYPNGPKITRVNFDASVVLASSMMQEAGVDVLIVPPISAEKIKEMQRFIKIPILGRAETKKDSGFFIDNNCPGVCLSLKTSIEEIPDIRKIVHK
ncbi:MAG: hypothetical protein V1709_04545 [Planctomycetota bacterium]